MECLLAKCCLLVWVVNNTSVEESWIQPGMNQWCEVLLRTAK